MRAMRPLQERSRRERIIRRTSNLLLVLGGILLAYPLWSSAYTQVQQQRLDRAFKTQSIDFARTLRAQKPTGRKPPPPAAELKRAAELFAPTLKLGDPVGRLVIPRIGVDLIVAQGMAGKGALETWSDHDLLRSSPTHYGTTPLPGLGQPFAIAGHRTTYGAPFFKLDKLRPGDEIKVETAYADFVYAVSKTTIVDPSDDSVLQDRGYDLVLTTCTPLYSSKQRLIVWGMMKSFVVK